MARKLLETIGRPFDLGSESASVSANIGITFLPGRAVDGEALLREADEALYASKRGGRNRYTEAAAASAA